MITKYFFGIFLAVSLAIPAGLFAQWDTNFYSQSWWGPSLYNSLRSGSGSGSSSGTTSGGSSGTSGSIGGSSGTSAPSPCPGKSILDLKNIPDTLQVKMDANWDLYYIGTTTKIELTHIDRTNRKIFYTSNDKEIGQITVCGSGYPEYGYIYLDKYNEAKGTTPSTTIPQPSTGATGKTPFSTSMPENYTPVTLDPNTGKVYNACDGKLFEDARYDVSANRIYYRDTNSTYGGVMTETTGYVNFRITDQEKDSRGCPISASIPESDIPMPGFYEGPFRDVNTTASYYEEVTFALEQGWIAQADKFYPQRPITRCEYAELIYKSVRIEPAEGWKATFTDVPVDSSYAAAVYAGVNHKFWKHRPGSKKTTFGCNKSLRRGEMAIVLNAVFDIQEAGTFTPSDTLPRWMPLETVRKVVTVSLLKPLGKDKKFRATKPVKRHEAITSLARGFGVK